MQEAKQAKEAIQNERLGLVREALHKSVLGPLVQQGVSELLKRGAQDVLGEEKLESSQCYLEKWPVTAEQQGAKLLLKSIDSVRHIGANMGLLTESVNLAQEAIQLWKPARQAENADALASWYTHLLDILKVQDVTLMTGLAQQLASSGVYSAFTQLASCHSEEDTNVSKLLELDAAVKALTDTAVHEEDLLAFLGLLQKFLVSLPNACCGTVGRSAFSEEELAPLAANSRLRRDILAYLVALGRMGSVAIPLSAQDAIDNFLSGRSQCSQDQSFLTLALALSIQLNKLSSHMYFSIADIFCFYVLLKPTPA